ncbi:DUF3159 domain-containing protein [Brachybacterium sp. GCM10030267]|uniref:DUF3159 domain-containing protein n=1 Tax=unclassified Brachybacterium TaxID=2623841 RepID=UPI003614BE7C
MSTPSPGPGPSQPPRSGGPADPARPGENAEPARPTPARSPGAGEGDPVKRGLGGVLHQEEFSVADAIGGPRGIAESVLPTLLFIVLYVATRSVTLASVSAVAVVAIFLVARLIQRQSPSTVLGGLIGVGLGAVLAIRSGDGSDFYAPGLAINAVALVVLAISLLVRRPLVGYFIGALDPRVKDWAQDPDARRVYGRATVLFLALYAAKLAVQVPLLLTGQVAALGVAKLAMGLPAFAVIAYLVWLMHRSLLSRGGYS